jgi:hypothetical protein
VEPETVEPKSTTIKTVSVKVRHEVDLGYVPFIAYMRKMGHKNPPFGMRDASRATFDIFLSAELGDEMTAEELATQLSRQAHAIADRELRSQYPESFKAAVRAEVPDEAYVIKSTEVVRVAEEF